MKKGVKVDLSEFLGEENCNALALSAESAAGTRQNEGSYRRRGYDGDRRGGYDSQRRGGYDGDRRSRYDGDRRGGYDGDRRGGYGDRDRYDNDDTRSFNRSGGYNNRNRQNDSGDNDMQGDWRSSARPAPAPAPATMHDDYPSRSSRDGGGYFNRTRGDRDREPYSSRQSNEPVSERPRVQLSKRTIPINNETNNPSTTSTTNETKSSGGSNPFGDARPVDTDSKTWFKNDSKNDKLKSPATPYRPISASSTPRTPATNSVDEGAWRSAQPRRDNQNYDSRRNFGNRRDGNNEGSSQGMRSSKQHRGGNYPMSSRDSMRNSPFNQRDRRWNDSDRAGDFGDRRERLPSDNMRTRNNSSDITTSVSNISINEKECSAPEGNLRSTLEKEKAEKDKEEKMKKEEEKKKIEEEKTKAEEEKKKLEEEKKKAEEEKQRLYNEKLSKVISEIASSKKTGNDLMTLAKNTIEKHEIEKKDIAHQLIVKLLQNVEEAKTNANWVSKESLGSLIEYIAGNSTKDQMRILFGIQEYFHQIKFPKGLIEKVFIALYDENLIDEESFLEYKDDLNDETPGKTSALIQLTEWLVWLETAEEEEESSDEEIGNL